MELTRCPILRAASMWSDYRRQKILRSIKKFEAGSCGKAGIGEQEGPGFPSRQRQTTHCFGDQVEIKELWLGSHTASTVLPNAPKQSRRTALWFNGRYSEVPGGLLRAEVTWLLQKWNYVSSRMLAELVFIIRSYILRRLNYIL